MNDGVKILLARMETHPEEFAYRANEGTSKWGRLLENFKHCLTKEEINAIDSGIQNIERERFTQLVMEELLDPKSEQLELGLNPYLVRSTLSAGQTQLSSTIQNPYSNTYGAITLEQTEHINAHAKALLKLDKQKKPTIKVRKPTKFGKLFNYT